MNIKSLTEDDIHKIKKLIETNFINRKREITINTIENEFNILKQHINLKHSHHINSLYDNEIILQIKSVFIAKN